MENRIKDMAREHGADAVGLTGVNRLGSLPSMDPTYLLAGARSVVSVMVAYDPGITERYLGKQDRVAMQRHETERYRRLDAIARAVAAVIRRRGYEAAVTEPNLDYRYKHHAAYRAVPPVLRQGLVDWLASRGSTASRRLKQAMVARLPDSPLAGGSFRLTPTFSHRYGAVAAGIGALGWSGNVLHPRYGARVLYHSIITDAVLTPDPMLTDTPCDACRICTRVCQGGFMDPRQEDSVVIGGTRFVHTKKAHNLRCIFVCGGLTGQSGDQRWSTWSPGRIRLPESDAELPRLWQQVARASLGRRNHYSRTLAALQYHADHGFLRKAEDRLPTTCGNCQLVCAPSRPERKALYRRIREAGCVPGVPPPDVGPVPDEGESG